MEKQLRILRKIRTALFVALTVALIVLLLVAAWALQCHNKAVASGWGDDEGGRPSYTLEEINADALGNSVVLNSISDSVMGNEKNFVGAREYYDLNTEGTENIWQANEIVVKNGQEYIVRAYVHNNNLWVKNTAENVMVAFNIPMDSSTSIPVHGFISADNTVPSEYWDGVLFTSSSNFHLEYVYGSALLENNGIGASGLQLSDEIVTKASSGGTLIGYYGLDGQIPAGYQYASYITIRVKAVFDTDYRVEQKMRLVGTKDWRSNVDAKVGDKVEIQIAYTNKSDESQRNVMIRDVMPKNLQYVAGSTVLYNTNHPQGMTINSDDIITNGINIGNYSPKGNAFVRFTATVVDNSLQCGGNVIVNWAQGGVGNKTIQDYACVTVEKSE